MAAVMTRCFECDDDVPVDEWDDHECQADETDGYDPAEPWMDPDMWDTQEKRDT